MAIMHPKLTDGTYTQLREHILEKTGIFLGDGKKYLIESRLGSQISKKGFDSFEEYYYYVKKSGDALEEENFFDTITTNETYFFRDTAQLNFFEKIILPALKEEVRSGRKYRIWSAGCSSGEEAYTMAILAANAIPGITAAQFEIIGTDISRPCLMTAKTGIYSSYSIKNMPEIYLKRYFTKKDEGYVVGREVRELVKFDKVNLVDSFAMGRIRGINLIFCKNVFIYFSDQAREKITESFHRSLATGGMLVLGPSEYLRNGDRLFLPQKLGQCVYYRKN